MISLQPIAMFSAINATMLKIGYSVIPIILGKSMRQILCNSHPLMNISQSLNPRSLYDFRPPSVLLSVCLAFFRALVFLSAFLPLWGAEVLLNVFTSALHTLEDATKRLRIGLAGFLVLFPSSVASFCGFAFIAVIVPVTIGLCRVGSLISLIALNAEVSATILVVAVYIKPIQWLVGVALPAFFHKRSPLQVVACCRGTHGQPFEGMKNHAYRFRASTT